MARGEVTGDWYESSDEWWLDVTVFDPHITVHRDRSGAHYLRKIGSKLDIAGPFDSLDAAKAACRLIDGI